MPTEIIKNELPTLAPSVKAFLLRIIEEMLTDPERNMVLTSKAKGRLSKALAKKGKTIPLSVLRRKYL